MEYDSPYGIIPLDLESQVELSRGAIQAIRAMDNPSWTHPLKLKDGTVVELNASLMLFMYDCISEYLNNQKRQR
jgi:hypothetical protein